jgi:hypothetical protein
VRRRLVEEHLLHPRRYRAACGIPSVAIEEPSFDPGFALWRCWRGPSWMNTAWLLAPAMRELGYPEWTGVVASLMDAAEHHGFREYYNPFTGEGSLPAHSDSRPCWSIFSRAAASPPPTRPPPWT